MQAVERPLNGGLSQTLRWGAIGDPGAESGHTGEILSLRWIGNPSYLSGDIPNEIPEPTELPRLNVEEQQLK